MNITIIQADLAWQNKTKNLQYFDKKIGQINVPTDLIVLPEMFTTGFSMKSQLLAETMNGPTLNWMAAKAKQTNALIMGSLIITEDDYFYNRLIAMLPDGNYYFYDKRHLFRMADEHHHYNHGVEQLVVEYKGWRIFPLICYDLRFPVWSRNSNSYDLLVCIANWAAPRSHAWKTLLLARAIENQVYVAGVNRVGVDGNDIPFSGDSAIIDMKGQIMTNLKPSVEGIETITLSLENLKKFREDFPAWQDADKFELK